jgi:DNA-directed RNA polymerase II subunit RPB2
VVDDDCRIIHQVSAQHSGLDEDITRQYTIHFGQIYLSKPIMTESDGSTQSLFPHEARLRNLTYAAPLYVDMKKEIRVADPASADNALFNDLGDMVWEVEHCDDEYQKVFIGKVPIMLRSAYCVLANLSDSELEQVGECPYDQGGYFVINGSEKVLLLNPLCAKPSLLIGAFLTNGN